MEMFGIFLQVYAPTLSHTVALAAYRELVTGIDDVAKRLALAALWEKVEPLFLAADAAKAKAKDAEAQTVRVHHVPAVPKRTEVSVGMIH